MGHVFVRVHLLIVSLTLWPQIQIYLFIMFDSDARGQFQYKDVVFPV